MDHGVRNSRGVGGETKDKLKGLLQTLDHPVERERQPFDCMLAPALSYIAGAGDFNGKAPLRRPSDYDSGDLFFILDR